MQNLVRVALESIAMYERTTVLEHLSEYLIMLYTTCSCHICSIVLLRHFWRWCEIMKLSCGHDLSSQFDLDQDINTILVLSFLFLFAMQRSQKSNHLVKSALPLLKNARIQTLCFADDKLTTEVIYYLMPVQLPPASSKLNSHCL